MEALLSQGLRALGLSPAPRQLKQLVTYAGLLTEKNKVMNLTAITDPQGIATLHFLDCASLLPLAGFAGKRVLDVGTGAGFPGLVLKILCPELELTLLDGLNKRVVWLEEVVKALELTGVTCIHGRAEELSREEDFRERFDLVTTRAVAELRILTELCLPYVKVGGRYLSMKGVDCGPELENAGRGVALLGGRLLPSVDYTIPTTQITHRVVPVEKVSPTPAKYPRRFAKIQKSPL